MTAFQDHWTTIDVNTLRKLGDTKEMAPTTSSMPSPQWAIVGLPSPTQLQQSVARVASQSNLREGLSGSWRMHL